MGYWWIKKWRLDYILEQWKSSGTRWFIPIICSFWRRKRVGILVLQYLRTFIHGFKFKGVVLASIIPLLDPQAWFAGPDNQEAYFHIFIHLAHRKFLMVLIGISPQVLPFRLSSAPRPFTNYFAVIAAHLRRHGIQIFPYLIALGKFSEQVTKAVQVTLKACPHWVWRSEKNLHLFWLIA